MSGSRRWRGRIASCDGRARFLAGPRRISPRRSSTADPGHESVHRRAARPVRGRNIERRGQVVHRRAPGPVRGRVAPQGASACPIDVLRGPGPGKRTGAGCRHVSVAMRSFASPSLGGGRRASGCDAIREHADHAPLRCTPKSDQLPAGIGDHFAPEWVITLDRNTHVVDRIDSVQGEAELAQTPPRHMATCWSSASRDACRSGRRGLGSIRPSPVLGRADRVSSFSAPDG